MATKDIHIDIKNWRNIDNLIELKRFQYSHVFELLYWVIGIMVTVIIFTIQIAETKSPNLKIVYSIVLVI